jgi:chromosome segregation ATPase
MSNQKIRVHNKGKREFTIPPEKKFGGDGKEIKGGKKRMLLPGRAIELEKETAKKYIKAYPRELIEFDSLVSGEKKNLTKENSRLESESKRLKTANQVLTDKVSELESEVLELKGDLDSSSILVDELNMELDSKNSEIKALTEAKANKKEPVEKG